MNKMNRWFFGLLLGLLWPSMLVLSAGESAPDAAAPVENVVSRASDDAVPGIDSAVQMAQEDVRDPFSYAELPEPETPSASAAAPA